MVGSYGVAVALPGSGSSLDVKRPLRFAARGRTGKRTGQFGTVDQAVHHLHRAGAQGDFLENFSTIAQSCRYGAPTLHRLAKTVTGAAGARKDVPLFELCHLVLIVDAAGFQGPDRMAFFMGSESVTPAQVRDILEQAVDQNGWRRPGIEFSENGVALDYDGDRFVVSFGRMPLLLGMFEFLSALDGFTFFAEFSDTLDELCAGPQTLTTLKKTSNHLSARLRKYRINHIEWARHEDRFERIAAFLDDRAQASSQKGQWCLDDDNLMEFWCYRSTFGDFKAYKTVFDAFISLIAVLRSRRLSEAGEQANIIGTDFESGEIDLSSEDHLDFASGDWVSPLLVFADDPAKRVKFFKGTSERKPLENLMKYGPDTLGLPRAFLRLEAFGPVQSIIVNDLKFKRHNDARIGEHATSYQDLVKRLADLIGHIEALQLATAYALGLGGDIVETRGGQAFEDLTRIGFEARPSTSEDRAPFEAVTGELSDMAGLLSRMIDRLETFDLAEMFPRDQALFQTQFDTLYGEAP